MQGPRSKPVPQGLRPAVKRFDQGLHVRRRSAGEAKPFAADGVRELKAVRVERVTGKGRSAGNALRPAAVEAVSHQRVPQVCQVDPDLMGPPRLERELD